MKKPGLSTFLYGGIAVCVTVMLILFAGTLSNDADKIQSAPVTDLLFTPESVVKLTAENQHLRENITENAITIDQLTDELMDEKTKSKAFNLMAKAASLIAENDTAAAAEVLEAIDLTNASENAKALYNMLLQQTK